MVYSLVVRARGLEYGGRELESRSLHLKQETKLREERGLSGCRKGLKTVPLAQALLSLKPAKTTIDAYSLILIPNYVTYNVMCLVGMAERALKRPHSTGLPTFISKLLGERPFLSFYGIWATGYGPLFCSFENFWCSLDLIKKSKLIFAVCGFWKSRSQIQNDLH